jgi:signal peptidase II
MAIIKNLNHIKNSFFSIENLVVSFFILVLFFLDRFSKIYVINNFNENTVYLNDYLNIDLLWNIGIGFGLFSTNSSLIYSLISILICFVIIFLFYLMISSKKFDKFTLAIIIGGALGNFYDRISYNAVPDFIDIHYKNYHWFTFNFADIFISLGIIMILLKDIFQKNE